MKLDRNLFFSPTGQAVLVATVLLLGVLAVRWQQQQRSAPPLPRAKPAPAAVLPKTLTREGAKFIKPEPAPAPALPTPAPASTDVVAPPLRDLPLTLFVSAPVPQARPVAPFGRLIRCETVVTLESNRLDTPVIGLVTEDVWHNGRRVIPAGAEVHGRAALDRTRERLGAQGTWRIVWRTADRDNGEELAVEGLALDCDLEPGSHRRGEHDGSAGLRGVIVRTEDVRELKLFAASFLATATSALQEMRPAAGLLGEGSLPVATTRNAVLAGTSAVLRDHAQAMREAIARDGFYLRVPAGKAFYLYITQPLDRSQAKPMPALASSSP